MKIIEGLQKNKNKNKRRMRNKIFDPGVLSFTGTSLGSLVTWEASQNPFPEATLSRRTTVKGVKTVLLMSLPYGSVFRIYYPGMFS